MTRSDEEEKVTLELRMMLDNKTLEDMYNLAHPPPRHWWWFLGGLGLGISISVKMWRNY